MNAENKNLQNDRNKPDTPRSKVYDADFKKEAVRRIRAGESSVKVGRALKVPTGTLSKWMKDPQWTEPPRVNDSRIPTRPSPSPRIADLAIIASNLDGVDDLEKIERAARLWDLAKTWLWNQELGELGKRHAIKMEQMSLERVPFEQGVAEARIPMKSPEKWLMQTLLKPDTFRRVLDGMWETQIYEESGGEALHAVIIGTPELPAIEAEEVESIINYWKATGIHRGFLENLREIRAEEYSQQKSEAGAKGGKKSKPTSDRKRR